MRRWIAVATLAIGVVSAGATTAPALAQDAAPPEQQEINLLFAQTANSGTMKPIKGTPRFSLKLRGVNPQVVWFSDRPARQSGHIPVPAFSRAWPGFGFEEDPPNAALTLLDAGDRHDTVVVELGRPHFNPKRNVVRYSAQILDEATGDLSHLESDRDRRVRRHFQTPSLFIDDATGKVVKGCLIQPLTSCPGAGLSGARLFGADLHGANLSGADLAAADLRTANLSGTDLSRSVLVHADMRGVRMGGADLSGADARFLCLSGTNLGGADLSGADLSGADLRFSDLRGVNLKGAIGLNLNPGNPNGAWFCHTKMPDGSINNRDCDLSPEPGTVCSSAH